MVFVTSRIKNLQCMNVHLKIFWDFTPLNLSFMTDNSESFSYGLNKKINTPVSRKPYLLHIIINIDSLCY